MAASHLYAQRPPWRDRIGTYLVGVAIGCVLVGWFMWARAGAVRKRQAEEAAAARAAQQQSEPAEDGPAVGPGAKSPR